MDAFVHNSKSHKSAAFLSKESRQTLFFEKIPVRADYFFEKMIKFVVLKRYSNI